ncbi:hypothetical protein PV325_002685 [Microctonus aethiopoides]|nr:hypothetical protein PV325_002685 [Microctonus aethiopoides]
MGNTIHRRDKEKSVLNERAVLKKVWSGVADNPQYHGNVFFLGFCKTYPQYTKYFTLDPEMPLTIDVHITTHFSIIMETIGYLVVDYYKNRKQHDFFIGYIAMVHKDMNIIHRDMSNFGVSLIDYLSATFPNIMTSDCHEIVSGYIFNLINNISQNIEELKKKDFSELIESSRQIKSPFVRWISCQDNLIYGKTIDFWNDRQRIWEARLEEWKRKVGTVKKPREYSSSDDDSTLSGQSTNSDDVSQLTQSPIQSSSKTNDSSRISQYELPHENAESFIIRPSITLRSKKSGETQYSVIETIDRTNEPLISDPKFEFTFDNDVLSISDSYGDTSDKSSGSSRNINIDSIARKRRRAKLLM